MRRMTWVAALVAALAWTHASADDRTASEKASDTASSAAQDVKQGSEHAWDKTKQGSEHAWDKTKEAGSNAGEDARQAGNETKQQADRAGDKAAASASQTGDQMKHGAQQASNEAQGMKSVSGTVKSIGSDKLTLENRLGEDHDFQLSSSTKFMQNGNSISRDEIKEGSRVRAAFSGDSGHLKASRIELLQGGSHDQNSSSQKSSSGASNGSGSRSSDSSK